MEFLTVALVGCGNEGKSMLIERMRSGSFGEKYIWSPIICFNTNMGVKYIKLLEFNELPNIPVHAIIVMFDVTQQQSYDYARKIMSECKKLTHNLVVCGNKVDLIDDRVVFEKNIHIHRHYGCKYFDVSAKSNYNVEKPYLTILKQFYGHDIKLIDT